MRSVFNAARQNVCSFIASRLTLGVSVWKFLLETGQKLNEDKSGSGLNVDAIIQLSTMVRDIHDFSTLNASCLPFVAKIQTRSPVSLKTDA